ncbi:MAG: hypothetical protein MJK12_18040 [Colwellia sp.]|nr:hypothetical protein [Colwellia sp.]
MKLLSFYLLSLSVFFYLPDAFAEQKPLLIENRSVANANIVSGFQFQSSKWLNLHHFLYDRARTTKGIDVGANNTELSDENSKTLKAAIEFYKKEYVKRSLLFDDQLSLIKTQLSQTKYLVNNQLSNNKIPSILLNHLNAVAPLYQENFWDRHHNENTVWINKANTLLAKHGKIIQDKLEKIFQHKLYITPIKYDIVYAPAYWAGAYTMDGHAVITSSRADYQGLAALEMVFHEATHGKILRPMQTEIKQLEQSFHYIHEKQLWHALQFYTVGEVVKTSLAQHGIAGYQPYAYKNGLYNRSWAKYEPLIVKFWQPYIEGKTNMKLALQEILSALKVDKM